MFDTLETIIIDPCKTKNFSLLGPVSERHGSWEWTFYKKGDGLDRYLIVSLTILSKALKNDPFEYSMDIRIGAEDGNRFVRHPFQQFHITEAFLHHPSEIISSRIKQVLYQAIDFADQLTTIDLVDVYLPKKPHPAGKKNQESGGRRGGSLRPDTSSDTDR
jgi:hypothetical protein